MFIGQCLNFNSTKLLEWIQLTNPNEQGKKRKPQWYSELENKIIISNNPDRYILYTQSQENIFHQYIEGLLTKATQIKWTASMKQYNIIIGKKKRVINKDRIMIKHYRQLFNSSPLEACKGCTLNETNSSDICLYKQNKNQIIAIPVKQSYVSTSQHLPVQGIWPRLKMSPLSIQFYFKSKIHHNTTNTNKLQDIQIHLDPKSEAERFIKKYIK